MNTNEFAVIKEFVTELLEQYRKVRKELGLANDAWHSRSIERISEPFVSGNFTLAVVGKVSSGKSTFINALLGQKNLLPTGHDQTTCGLTYIEYGETPEATIEFGDGHTVNIKDDLEGKIKPYVAIPKRFHDLPVNRIDEMILGGFDFERIWESHKQLEDETLCNRINKALLKEYVDNRQKKDIAEVVRLKYPFNEELKGWCVIDTPGIGAIGGIEIETRKLLARQKEDRSRVVDAIVFLQDGSQTLDQTDTKAFVKEQLDSFSESDKHRLFYVLTKSGSSVFLNHKDEKIGFITKNYGDRIRCLTYADSLLHSFLNYLSGSDLDLKAFDDFEKPDGWDKDEWDNVMGMLFYAKRHLKVSGDAVNNETLFRTIKEWAHFDTLKASINKFAKEEKQQTLKKLSDYIRKDYQGVIKALESEMKTLQGDLSNINNQINLLDKSRVKYSEKIRKIDLETSNESIQERFKFVEDAIDLIKGADTIWEIRTEVTNLFDKVQEKEKSLFNGIKNQYEKLLNEVENDVQIESLDLDSIEQEARNNKDNQYMISPPQVEKHFSAPDTYIKAKYKTDHAKVLREFKSVVIRKTKSKRDKFLIQVEDKIGSMGTQVREDLNARMEAKKQKLEDLKPKLAKKETYRVEVEAKIKRMSEELCKMDKYVKEYGIQCQ